MRTGSIVTSVIVGMLFPIAAGAEEVMRLEPRPAVILKLLVSELKEPELVALLFPGGHGRVNIDDQGAFGNLRGNFLVRSRKQFRRHKIVTAIFDSPSDRKDRDGLSYEYRMTNEHGEDIGAAVAALRRQFRKPVWLIGTSRGTLSAANGATRLKTGAADGLVLTASVGVENRRGADVLKFDLASLRIPTLVVHHKSDHCRVTPPRGARSIRQALVNAERAQIFMVGGGIEKGDPCQGRSHHGFRGIERQTIDAIAGWMLRNESP